MDPFVSAFRTSASATRPVRSDGASPNACYGLLCTETGGAAARMKFYSSALAKPSSAPTAVEDAAAGAITVGRHRFKVTYLTAQGETEPSDASAVFTASGAKKVDLSAIPTLPDADGGRLVTGRNIYMNSAGLNEVQTLTVSAGAAADTLKLTYDGVESSAVTIPGGGIGAITAAQIQTAIDSIPALVGNATVSGPVGGPFVITFGGTLVDTDAPAITVTSKTGAADGSVAETTKGVAQGTTWRKVTSGTAAVIADNTTTTLADLSLSDATLAGYNAAPTANTSGILQADVRLAANSSFWMEIPGGPVSAYLARCEITTGACDTTLYGK